MRRGEKGSQWHCVSCPTGGNEGAPRVCGSERDRSPVSAQAASQEPVRRQEAHRPEGPWPGDGLQTLGLKAQKQQHTHVLSRLHGNT